MQNSLRTAGDGGPYEGLGCVADLRAVREGGPYGRLGVGTDILGGPFGLGAWRTSGPSGRPVPTMSTKNPVPCGTGFLIIN